MMLDSFHVLQNPFAARSKALLEERVTYIITITLFFLGRRLPDLKSTVINS